MEKETKVAAVSMKNITKTFGSVIANDKVNLDIYKGEILSLLGENGSGKTTLMNMLSGIYFPDEGQIFINGKEEVIRSPKDALRNIKAVNPSADVIFEDSNGEIDEIFEEDLPYDLNQDPIVLDNQGYGIWYLDSMDHLERYEGKNIQFLAMVLKPEEYPDGYFVPGRMAMTCCAEDMAFLGYACEFAGTKDLKQKEWVKVTAKVAREYFADYKGEGPVLHAISVEKAKAPKDPVISFN